MQIKRNGQFTTEYMIILGIALSTISVFLIYVFFYYTSYSNTISSNQALTATQLLAQNANYVASLGLGSKITFPVNFPEITIPNSYFCGSYVEIVAGQYSSIQKSNLNLLGVMPMTMGNYITYERYNNSGAVQVGVQGPISYINTSYSFNVNSLTYSLVFYNSSYKVAVNTAFNISVFSSGGAILNTTSTTAISGAYSGSLFIENPSPTMVIDVFAPTGDVVAASCFAS